MAEFSLGVRAAPLASKAGVTEFYGHRDGRVLFGRRFSSVAEAILVR